MRKATVTEAKNGLSALLDRVRGGETILIVDRGRPVARLVPAASVSEDAAGRLARLERAGIVVPARSTSPASIAKESIVKVRPPRARGPASVLRALLDERAESR